MTRDRKSVASASFSAAMCAKEYAELASRHQAASRVLAGNCPCGCGGGITNCKEVTEHLRTTDDRQALLVLDKLAEYLDFEEAWCLDAADKTGTNLQFHDGRVSLIRNIRKHMCTGAPVPEKVRPFFAAGLCNSSDACVLNDQHKGPCSRTR